MGSTKEAGGWTGTWGLWQVPVASGIWRHCWVQHSLLSSYDIQDRFFLGSTFPGMAAETCWHFHLPKAGRNQLLGKFNLIFKITTNTMGGQIRVAGIVCFCNFQKSEPAVLIGSSRGLYILGPPLPSCHPNWRGRKRSNPQAICTFIHSINMCAYYVPGTVITGQINSYGTK